MGKGRFEDLGTGGDGEGDGDKRKRCELTPFAAITEVAREWLEYPFKPESGMSLTVGREGRARGCTSPAAMPGRRSGASRTSTRRAPWRCSSRTR